MRAGIAVAALLLFGAVTVGALALTSTQPSTHRSGATHRLYVAKTGEGSGTITSSPDGIDCGDTCFADFAAGSLVTLTAAPDEGSTLEGWTGDCIQGHSRNEAYVSNKCTIKMDGDHMVEAYFEGEGEEGSTLSVAKGGDGSGTITSSPDGIDCGDTCSHEFDPGKLVILTATPDPGSVFKGWTGDCRERHGKDGKHRDHHDKTCKVKMTENHMVMALFYTSSGEGGLNVSKGGDGSGTVTSDPAGIDCGDTCSADFDPGASVKLTATADEGSVFRGWLGDCKGRKSRDHAYVSPTCIIVMDHRHWVKAFFSGGGGDDAATLHVLKRGDGTVKSDPAGIACGETCSHDFALGTRVTLTAQADEGFVFKGWAGDCKGRKSHDLFVSATCTVSMKHRQWVKAYFAESGGGGGDSATLKVVKEGDGTVTSDPAGIDCGTDCTSSFDEGVHILLTATPADGAVFTGWGGACKHQASRSSAYVSKTCKLELDGDRWVAAHFATGEGAKACKVPNVERRRFVMAKRALARANCRTGHIGHQYSSRVDKNRIIWQSAAPGEELAAGAKVNLLVSLGSRNGGGHANNNHNHKHKKHKNKHHKHKKHKKHKHHKHKHHKHKHKHHKKKH